MGRSDMVRRSGAVLGALVFTACGGATRAATAPPAQPATVPAPSAEAPAAQDPPPPRAEAPPAKPASAGPRFDGVPGTSIRFTGGDGSSVEHAIVIEGAQGETDGVQSEYWYVGQLYGRQDVDFNVKGQALLQHAGHPFDQLDIELKSGEARVLVFDISGYFGKF